MKALFYNLIFNRVFFTSRIFLTFLLIITFSSIGKGSQNKNRIESTILSNSIPNYTLVFPQDRVNRIDITIDSLSWETMMNDLTNKFGVPREKEMKPMDFKGPHEKRMGSHGFNEDQVGPPPPDFNMKVDSNRMHMPHFPMNGENRMKMESNDPIYVSCTIMFNGEKWHNVAFRFKGNSSLMMSWNQGIKKLPFRLDFLKYNKNQDTETNQTFYGFSKISFSSNNNDLSLVREKMMSDIFSDFGVKSPKTAFYRVYIDYGKGPIYFGLYTAVEIVDDTMLKSQFGNNSGNCYKPDGSAASFSGKFDKKSFDKKTNTKKNIGSKASWSDVEKLFEIINSDTRITNPEQWCNNLELVFDIPVFIRWLAANTTAQNWDTYGNMAHNYYLYNDPSTNKLIWIPWDNNEALSDRGRSLSISLDEVSSRWPLIRYILDQPQYYTMYKNDVAEFVSTTYTTESMKQKLQFYHQLISPFVIGKDGETKGYTFLQSPDQLEKSILEIEKHTENRCRVAKEFLGTPSTNKKSHQ